MILQCLWCAFVVSWVYVTLFKCMFLFYARGFYVFGFYHVFAMILRASIGCCMMSWWFYAGFSRFSMILPWFYHGLQGFLYTMFLWRGFTMFF